MLLDAESEPPEIPGSGGLGFAPVNNRAMPDRRSFLTKLGITSLLLASASPASAQAAPEASAATPPPSPLPSETASAKPAKGPSASAAAIAAAMRRFDPKLDDAEIAKIAAAIDDNAGAGAALNPKKHRLKNSDEPATRFSADLR